MLKKLISLFTVVSLAASANAIVPRVLEVAAVLGIRHNPAQVLLYRLSSLDKTAYEREIQQALAVDDAELARSLTDLAQNRGFPIEPALLQKIVEAEQFSVTRSTRQLLTGAVTGQADSPTAFAGALAADLTVVGDIRDLTQQTIAYPNQDNLTVTLAATGVALTGLTVFSGGTSVVGKVGISAIKAARKMGRLSKGLERQLVRLADDAIDMPVFKAMARDIGSLNFTAFFNGAKRLIKPRVAKELANTGDALQHVFIKQGYRGTLQVLETADDTADIRRLRGVSDNLGTKFRAALHLKRGAKLTLHVADIFLHFLGWIMAAIGWLAWAAWFAVKMAWKTVGVSRRGVAFFRKHRLASHKALDGFE